MLDTFNKKAHGITQRPTLYRLFGILQLYHYRVIVEITQYILQKQLVETFINRTASSVNAGLVKELKF